MALSWDAWLTLAVVGMVFVALVRRIGPPDAVILGGGVMLALAGVIKPEDAFSGFVNPGVLTVAALFVVAAAMRETGALDGITARLLGSARTDRGAMLRMAAPVTCMSAFLNNTPIVAMLLPVLSDWCRKNHISPSRLLIPLSYMAILGGTCTYIGTSTNLVVNGMMIEAARTSPELAEPLKALGLFELSAVGVPFAVVGVLYLLFAGRRLLPDRKDLLEQLGESRREYFVDMRIEPGCRLAGQNVAQAGLRHLPGLFLVEIVRDDHAIAPVGPNEIMKEDDVLTFTGVVSTIVDLERIPGLVPVADAGYETRPPERRSTTLCEAVISGSSPVAGKSIRAADFRAAYNAAVIAVHRGGERLRGRVGDIVLRHGDTLLLQAGSHFARAHRNNPDFYLVSAVEEARPVRHDKTILSLGLLAGLVVLLTTQAVPTVVAAYLVAGLMVATRCISSAVARQSVDWRTLITLGAAFGLGKALDKSGCAAALAGTLVQHAGGWGPYAVLAITYIVTSILTEIMTNRAAVVLMFPIALAIAAALGVNPRTFVMATTFAAAATFVTPLGYQTNLMVYGPGGYRYTDFVRVGLPLELALTALAVFLIPLAWPF